MNYSECSNHYSNQIRSDGKLMHLPNFCTSSCEGRHYDNHSFFVPKYEITHLLCNHSRAQIFLGFLWLIIRCRWTKTIACLPLSILRNPNMYFLPLLFRHSGVKRWHSTKLEKILPPCLNPSGHEAPPLQRTSSIGGPLSSGLCALSVLPWT